MQSLIYKKLISGIREKEISLKYMGPPKLLDKYRIASVALGMLAVTVAFIDFEYVALKSEGGNSQLWMRLVFSDIRLFFVYLLGLHSVLFLFLPNANFVKATDYLYYGLVAMGVLTGTTLNLEKIEALSRNLKYQEMQSSLGGIEFYCSVPELADGVSPHIWDQLYPLCDRLEMAFLGTNMDLSEYEIKHELRDLMNIYYEYYRIVYDIMQTPLKDNDRIFLSNVEVEVKLAADVWMFTLAETPPRETFLSKEFQYKLAKLWPILLFFALAIRLTRVTAELSYLRR